MDTSDAGDNFTGRPLFRLKSRFSGPQKKENIIIIA